MRIDATAAVEKCGEVGKRCDGSRRRRRTGVRSTGLLVYFAKLEATFVDMPRYPWQRDPEMAICSAAQRDKGERLTGVLS